MIMVSNSAVRTVCQLVFMLTSAKVSTLMSSHSSVQLSLALNGDNWDSAPFQIPVLPVGSTMTFRETDITGRELCFGLVQLAVKEITKALSADKSIDPWFLHAIAEELRSINPRVSSYNDDWQCIQSFLRGIDSFEVLFAARLYGEKVSQIQKAFLKEDVAVSRV